jgi:hypothetical protein
VHHAVPPFTNSDSDNEDDATQFDIDAEYLETESAAGTRNISQGLERGSFTNVHAVPSQQGVLHTTINDCIETKPLKILVDANTPHFLYQDILNPGCNVKASGYNFEPEQTTRKAAITHIEHWFNLDHCRPTQVHVLHDMNQLHATFCLKTCHSGQAQRLRRPWSRSCKTKQWGHAIRSGFTRELKFRKLKMKN